MVSNQQLVACLRLICYNDAKKGRIGGVNMDYRKTAELIQSARKEKGLTQRELADLLGVTDRAVSKWERAKSFPDVSMLQPLADVLDISVTEILDGERRPQDRTVTAGEAEQAAIRGIDAYVSHTRRKSKPLLIALAVLLVILAAVGIYEYEEYSQRPVNFQEDELVFADMVYRVNSSEVYRFELQDVFGQELRNQLTEFLRTMPQGKEVRKVPEARAILKHVDLEGLAAFYEDCYYDYRNGKYYEVQNPAIFYHALAGICENLISDESYQYTGPVRWENGGKYLSLECELTEKPMELILARYIDNVNAYDPAVRPGFHRSYVINSITRLTPEEYEKEDEYEYWFSKEIPYREIYCYRIYKMEITFVDSDLYRGSGAQFPEGKWTCLFMAAKNNPYGDFEIRDEYIGNYWSAE